MVIFFFLCLLISFFVNCCEHIYIYFLSPILNLDTISVILVFEPIDWSVAPRVKVSGFQIVNMYVISNKTAIYQIMIVDDNSLLKLSKKLNASSERQYYNC